MHAPEPSVRERITPESVTLYPRKTTALGLVVVSAGFVVAGVWMIRAGIWLGLLPAGFFGLGVLVGLVQLVPGSSYLRIDQAGFTFCSLFRKKSIPWSVVGEFFLVTIRQGGTDIRTMVAWNFSPLYEGARQGRRLSQAIAGCEGALPDTYGKTPEELVDLLNECRRLFTADGVA